MKMPCFSTCAALAVLFTAHFAASAKTAAPGSAAHQHAERARIRQGVASGELTRAEAARLKSRQAAICQDKRTAKADGVVTRDERQVIRQDERQASRAIYRQKHDDQVRH